jgi:hypothetical protein
MRVTPRGWPRAPGRGNFRDLGRARLADCGFDHRRNLSMTSPRTRRLVCVAVLALVAGPVTAAPPARAAYTHLLVANLIGGNVTQYNAATGASLGVFAAGPLQAPRGLAVGPGHNVYVGDLALNDVSAFNGLTGAPIGAFVAPGSGGLSGPGALAFGPNGDLFVTSQNTDDVLEYRGATGAFVGVFAAGHGLSGPTGLAFGPDGNLYVASAGSNAILEFSGTTGAFLQTFATAGLNGPAGLRFASDGSLFVANFGANNVLRFSPAGVLRKSFAGGSLVGPSDLAFDLSGGLLVAGTNNNAVLRYNANLASNTFTFDRVFVSTGLGGPVSLAFPVAVAVAEPPALVLFGLGAAGASCLFARKPHSA